MTKHKPRILVTMGDTAGGRAGALRALARACGDGRALHADRVRRRGGAGPRGRSFVAVARCAVVSAEDWAQKLRGDPAATIVDFAAVDARAAVPGRRRRALWRGFLSLRSPAAIDACLAGQADAICTGPINKEALHAAGINTGPHGDFRRAHAVGEKWCMMLTSAEITCSLVTAHVGYHEVPGLLSVGANRRRD